MIRILATIIMLGLLVYCIVKKYNIPTVMFVLSVLGYLGIWIANSGESILGADSVGSAFLDIFEKMNGVCMYQLTSAVLPIILIAGYVSFMDQIKASEMFARILLIPLRKVRAPYLLATLVIPVAALMKLAIPASISVAALLIATIFPVLIRLGVTRQACATSIVLGATAVWGPADASLYMGLNLMHIENYTVTQWLVDQQMTITGICVVVQMFVFYLTTRCYDRDLPRNTDAAPEEQSLWDTGIPIYYGILPLLPLTLMLVFSDIVMGSIVIGVTAAIFLSFSIAILVHFLNRRDFREVFEDCKTMYVGMGKSFANVGIIMFFGGTFANMISSIGGMSLLVGFFSKIVSGKALAFTVSLLGTVISALTGTYTGNMPLIMPILAEIVAIFGYNAPAICYMGQIGCASGLALSPVAALNIGCSSGTGTDILTLIRRSILPKIIGVVAGLAATLLIYT